MKRLVLGIALILLIMGTPDIAQVRVTGECSNCHAMHYSQGGGQLSEWGSSGPYKALTIDTCLGCHTGTNTGSNTVPYVFSTTEPTYGANTLAGGNFFWVGQGDDAKGHNVLGIAGDDQKLGEAPGNPNHCANSCHYSLASNSDGKGCEGCHLKPAHHADDSATVVGAADNSTDGYYRFLSGDIDMSGSTSGVCGIEDDDWQYTKNATDHNEYMGYSGDKRYDAGFYNLGHTMTAFCSGCHGDFHEEQDWGSNWVRHPSDAVIPDSGEYASAFGASGGTGTYDPLVPVARPSLSGWTGPGSSVTLGTGGDMVMCLSCHRAHGSPYYKMMRWDYKNWPGEGTNGCGVCHTSKN